MGRGKSMAQALISDDCHTGNTPAASCSRFIGSLADPGDQQGKAYAIADASPAVEVHGAQKLATRQTPLPTPTGGGILRAPTYSARACGLEANDGMRERLADRVISVGYCLEKTKTPTEREGPPPK
ncbi:hypothetical protein YWS52_07980 [Chitiniphilus shinanonensis]